jgi:hypothetical protein
MASSRARRLQSTARARRWSEVCATKKNVCVKLVRAADRKSATVIFESGRPSRPMQIDDYLNNYFDADSTDTLYALLTLRTPGFMPDSELEVENLLEGENW